jgi:hypothetical protein
MMPTPSTIAAISASRSLEDSTGLTFGRIEYLPYSAPYEDVRLKP